MKHKGTFFATLFFIVLLIACSQPVETSEHTAETALTASTQAPSTTETDGKPFVLTLTRPRVGEFGYVPTEYVNRTEFYPESKTKNRPNIFHIAKEPVSLTKKSENGITTYWIDNEPYICIEKVLTDTEAETWPESYYYEWSYDRRFFYKYAETSSGTLYRNQNTESLEALILDDNAEWQYLLVRTDSPFASAQTMSIDDFGLVVIDDELFAKAKDFEILFYANTRGIDQKIVFPLEEPEGEFDAGSGLPLTFECTRLPGLRYTFHAFPSKDYLATFVDSRAENGRVLVYGPTILPMDEWQQSQDARFGAE